MMGWRDADRSQGMPCDGTIESASVRGRKRYPHPLRGIGRYDRGSAANTLFLATNLAFAP